MRKIRKLMAHTLTRLLSIFQISFPFLRIQNWGQKSCAYFLKKQIFCAILAKLTVLATLVIFTLLGILAILATVATLSLLV